MSDQITAVQTMLREHADPSRPDFLSNWFKNRPGYPPDDSFLGVRVPVQRATAKKNYQRISLHDTQKLLQSVWHEERLTALFILLLKYQKFDFNRQTIFDMYMSNLLHINNWDLVDSSAPGIVGRHLSGSPYKMRVLKKLATSSRVWERRIAIISTLYNIKQGSGTETLELAAQLSDDTDAYIHKATGRMLREMGKRIDEELLIDYLNQHAAYMPRTMVRYAIEKLPPQVRSQY